MMLSTMKRPSVRFSGFTLIELMIVIAIVGILATWAIPSYMRYTMRTARFDGQALASQVLVAAQRYYQQHATYPDSVKTLTNSADQTELISENGHFSITIAGCDSIAFTRCMQVNLNPASDLAQKLSCRLMGSNNTSGCAPALWIRTTGETSAHWRKAI